MRMENESSLSLTISPPILTVICKNKHLNVLVWNWSCCSSEYSGIQFQIGLPCFMNSSRGHRLYWKWWQIKSFLVCMIFTPQCLVSRYNLAKIDPINIKSKQLYCPHFGIICIVWWRTQNILSGNKIEIDSESKFYWHHVPQDEIVQNMETRERSKLRLRLHGSGRILLQIAVLFAWVHRNFCAVSALEWLFWISSALHSTNHVTLSPDCGLRNRTVERGGQQNACVAKVTGLCVVVIFTKYQCFSVFCKKICLKEDEVWGNFFSNKIIVTLVRQGLSSSLLARPVAYSHTKMAATVKNLTFTDEELPLHVLVGYKQKLKAKALIRRL